MPLSEEEQRLLDQLEQALTADDPKFASALRGKSLRLRARRHAIIAGCAFGLGVVLLMTGVIAKFTPISIVGFVVMLASAYFGLSAWRKSNQPEPLRVVGSERAAHPSNHRLRGGKPGRQPGRQHGQHQTGRQFGRQRGRSHGDFMSRMEERWRRRRESGF